MYARFVNWLSATAFGSWLVKHLFSRVDPVVFKATNGRLTLTGVPTLPMLTLTTTGRKSGKPRDTQLAYHADGGDFLVVASAMGQERHPDWSYNLLATADAAVQLRGERVNVRAELLDDADKQRVWPDVKRTIPQMNVYEQRTSRNIRVFRLRRIAE